MLARSATVAFEGIGARAVDVQVQLAPGMVAFTLVGLPDKAVAESRERVRAALHAMGLALPAKRITVNLAPADLLKEGSHYDLPIALALLAAMEILPAAELQEYLALGELALDGGLPAITGTLPAAMEAHAQGRGLICPEACGPEAAWAAEELRILAAPSLLALLRHFKGESALARPAKQTQPAPGVIPDMKDIKGQECARRALEIAAAGGHNLLLIGPPGAGKSMLAARLPGLLPLLAPAEALEVSMIHSVAGALAGGALLTQRPFRDPHHSASLPALVGGGLRARPGEISLAHRGVLFLDELPEFARATLESLRQPLETGHVSIARANHHVRYPARFQLIAAMNPCRCGYLDDPVQGCGRAPKCAQDYQARLSGPLLDRIDMHLDVPAVRPAELAAAQGGEDTAQIRRRVIAAQKIQQQRAKDNGAPEGVWRNADAGGDFLQAIATPDAAGQALLADAAEKLRLSARGWQRVQRVARTIADLAGADSVARPHVAEALSYRRLAFKD